MNTPIDNVIRQARDFWSAAKKTEDDEVFVDQDRFVRLRELCVAHEILNGFLPCTNDASFKATLCALRTGELVALDCPEGGEIPRLAWPDFNIPIEAYGKSPDVFHSGGSFAENTSGIWYSNVNEISEYHIGKGLEKYVKGKLPVVRANDAVNWLLTLSGRPRVAGRPTVVSRAVKKFLRDEYPELKKPEGMSWKALGQHYHKVTGKFASESTLRRCFASLERQG